MSDLWAPFRQATPARIGLGRRASLPTAEVLAQKLAHARAQDAVFARWDLETLREQLARAHIPSDVVVTQARAREEYLTRPDSGRALDRSVLASFAARAPGPWDVAFLVSDGLSALAADRHAAALVTSAWHALRGRSIAPVALASNARVAAGDPLGEALAARVVVVVLGERPGLSSTDSLGLYLTAEPRPGRTDAERECISNVCPGRGLDLAAATELLAARVEQALRTGRTGVSAAVRLGPSEATPLLGDGT